MLYILRPLKLMQIYFSPLDPTVVPYCEKKEVAMEFLLGVLPSLESVWQMAVSGPEAQLDVYCNLSIIEGHLQHFKLFLSSKKVRGSCYLWYYTISHFVLLS